MYPLSFKETSVCHHYKIIWARMIAPPIQAALYYVSSIPTIRVTLNSSLNTLIRSMYRGIKKSYS